MKIIVLIFLGSMALLRADVASDLASLDVQLTSLSKRLPTKPDQKVKKARQPIPKSEYMKWPEGTEINYKGQWLDFLNKVAPIEEQKDPNYTVALGTELRPMDSTMLPIRRYNFPVTIGKLSYDRWKESGFYTPFIAIDKEDYKQFVPGVTITIARPSGKNVVLTVGKDRKINNIGNYLDEKARLLNVIELKSSRDKQDLTKILNTIGLDTAYERFQEEEKPSDDDEDFDF